MAFWVAAYLLQFSLSNQATASEVLFAHECFFSWPQQYKKQQQSCKRFLWRVASHFWYSYKKCQECYAIFLWRISVHFLAKIVNSRVQHNNTNELMGRQKPNTRTSRIRSLWCELCVGLVNTFQMNVCCVFVCVCLFVCLL